MDLCQTHCKQVPDFSRASRSDLCHVGKSKSTHVAFLQFLPSGQYGLCFGYCFSGPLHLRSHYNRLPFVEFPQRRGSLLGACFRESLIFRLHSDIDQIHLSIEAQCGTACLPMGDCHNPTNFQIHIEWTVLSGQLCLTNSYGKNGNSRNWFSFQQIIPMVVTMSPKRLISRWGSPGKKRVQSCMLFYRLQYIPTPPFPEKMDGGRPIKTYGQGSLRHHT